MRTWAKVGLVFIMVVAGAIAVQANKPRPQVSMHCESRASSGTCVVDNKGGAPAEVDFNVVLVCHDGEHIAHVGARLEANSSITKIVEGFEPSVGLLSRCEGLDIRDKIVKENGQS